MLTVLAASLFGDRLLGDRFDIVRWERDTIAGKWLYLLGEPLRDDPSPDEAIARYFAAPPGSEERRRLEGAVEHALAGRIDAAAREAGLRGALPAPGTVFPPVNIELTQAPRVLVQSPRTVIQRLSTALLSPGLDAEDAARIERDVEGDHPDRSALVVPSGGVATYPAIVAEGSSYAGTVSTAAHEWTHHYLQFYPLGFNYFSSRDATAINETVADIVGDELRARIIEQWGDPTRPAATPTPTPTATATPPRRADVNATLRDLRLEVDALLAAGKVEEAEARMEAVRQELWAAGFRIRRLNQAYFAWYGSYAARPDATDPLGGQLRELRRLSGSLERFVEVVRETSTRAEVLAALERLRAGG
ncbi:MAG: hypothetical protein AB7G21_00725 [Dehalococcoidia bacterium]